jgi:hypothetical protein
MVNDIEERKKNVLKTLEMSKTKMQSRKKYVE